MLMFWWTLCRLTWTAAGCQMGPAHSTGSAASTAAPKIWPSLFRPRCAPLASRLSRKLRWDYWLVYSVFQKERKKLNAPEVLIFYSHLLYFLFFFIFSTFTDRVRPAGGRKVRLQDPPLANVRVHDQLYPQAQTPAGKIHDEQCSGKLYNSTGKFVIYCWEKRTLSSLGVLTLCLFPSRWWQIATPRRPCFV